MNEVIQKGKLTLKKFLTSTHAEIQSKILNLYIKADEDEDADFENIGIELHELNIQLDLIESIISICEKRKRY